MASAGPPNAIRFSVGSLEGRRGGLWTVWTGPKGDIYIGPNGVTGDIKASLHASGSWRFGFADEHYKNPAPTSPPKKKRVLSEWQRPGPFLPGFTRAFVILVPDEHVVTPQDEAIHDLEVHWIPRPGPYREVHISFIFGPASATGWPGRDPMGTELIHQEVLGTDELLWIVWHSVDLTEERKKALAEAGAHRRNERPHPVLSPAMERDPLIRSFMMGIEDGTGVFQDLSVPVLLGHPIPA